MKSLRFTVPLLRFVIPIDRLQAAKSANAKGRDQSALMQKPPNISLQTLLRLLSVGESLGITKHTNIHENLLSEVPELVGSVVGREP